MKYEYKVISTYVVDSDTVTNVTNETEARAKLDAGFFIRTNEEIVFVETRD